MSGDVQPRRRKDKKRKRDDRKSEGEVIFSRKQSLQDDDESSHGVHSTNMGADDQHLHIHEDHGTGGNWYQKCAFVVLMAILLGLVGLIIVENRGLADLDTPLSESRYSEYLHGWVEEHREEHDDHDEVQASLEDHDEHDEPFEEEEDHSEVDDDHEHDDDDDREHDDDDDEDHEDDDEAHEEEDEDDTTEKTKEEDEDNDEDVTAEQTEENDDDHDNEDDDDDEQNADNVTKEDGDDDEDDDDEDEDVTKTAEDDDDDEEIAKTEEDEDEDDENDATVEADDDEEDEDDADDDENNTLEAASTEVDNDENEDGDDDDEEDNNDSAAPSKPTSTRHHSKADDFDDTFDEEDDDGTAESLENIVVDNDAEEMLLLQKKEQRWAAQNQPPKADGDDEEPEVAQSFFGNLAVKIGVGVALALVARFVLMRKNPSTNVEPSAEVLMKRRLTIANAEDAYPDDEDAPPLSEDDLDPVEDLEMEEEIEYVEEEEEEIEIELDEHGEELPPLPKYIPETFEQLNAMYRSKDSTPTTTSRLEEINLETRFNNTQQQLSTSKQHAAPVFTAPPPPPLEEAKIQPAKYVPTAKSPETAKVSFTEIPSTSGKPNIRALPEVQTREVTHDLDFQPEDEDIDYSTDDDYDVDDEDIEEEEEEIEDIMNDDGSDVDDTELMNRLEAKYGRLPAKEYESDEDPDDPTWTQINPKQTPGGGPQAQEGDFYSIHNKLRQEENPNVYEDHEYEREMALANDELLRGKHLSALVAFYKITHNFPDRPMGFLGKAKLLDHFGQLRGDINLLTQSVDAYKRYLAFDELIENDLQFQQAAEACIKTMHYLGQYEPALNIHRLLINRFSDDPEYRNQLANTLLIMDRFSDTKVALINALKIWPQDGYAHVLLGYVLKMNDHQYAKAVYHLRQGLESKAKGTQDARFYIALGDAYERLDNQDDAHKIYKLGAELKLYPSHYQRSIFNEPNLRAQPIWELNETTYAHHLNHIAENWQTIRNEANSMLEVGGHFRREMEDLLAIGNWKELELFSRGRRNHKNCQHAPTTCWLIEQFPAAAVCRRGQVKFSVMHPGTQVRPHCGPTNCRLRAHLGLIVPPGTHLRVANHRTTWVEGSFLIFDDSFEHEVWHEGDSIRLILIVDFWHPDLNSEEIGRLSAV